MPKNVIGSIEDYRLLFVAISERKSTAKAQSTNPMFTTALHIDEIITNNRTKARGHTHIGPLGGISPFPIYHSYLLPAT